MHTRQRHGAVSALVDARNAAHASLSPRRRPKRFPRRRDAGFSTQIQAPHSTPSTHTMDVLREMEALDRAPLDSP